MRKVIEVSNLTKEYKLGTVGRGTLYRDLQSFWAKIRNKEDPNSIIGKSDISSFEKKSFLALNSINLNIYEGEIIGIIGANGAGKSTILKILSKITGPTKGTIKIRGRIASLLEVGTGFHTELTGRENIYLNATMNGLSIKEINTKVDDIIDFAGLEKFIDTPVKRYSSGMFVRLGFAVAAFLEPDILIVDEVLAVGDANFQKKALNKIESVSKNKKRTVLFVSHNMEAVEKLCSSVVILDRGHVVDKGPTKNMIEKYLNNKNDIRKKFKKITWKKSEFNPGGNIVKLNSIETKNSKNITTEDFFCNEEIIIETSFSVIKSGFQVSCLLEFYSNNRLIFQTFDDYINAEWGKQKNYELGDYKSICKIPKNFFNLGIVDINIVIFTPPGSYHDSFQVSYPTKSIGAISFNVIDIETFDKSSGSYPFNLNKDAIINPRVDHKIKKI